MTKVMRPSCWHQKFGPNGLSAPALGLCTCIKSQKTVHKIRGHSFFLNMQPVIKVIRPFCLHQNKCPQVLSLLALGLSVWVAAYRKWSCISKFVLIQHILSTQVSDTGPMVVWFAWRFYPTKQGIRLGLPRDPTVMNAFKSPIIYCTPCYTIRMSHDMTKSTEWVCAQRKLRSVCALSG